MKIHIPRTVAEVMTKDVVSVEEDDTLSNLQGSLQALKFRHLPVTDDNRLIGLVTQTDLTAVASSNLLPHHTSQDRALQERFHVRDIMVRNVVTITPDATIQQAARLLARQRLGCLPVVNADNVLVGILTASDFVRLIATAQQERAAPGGGEPEQLS